MEAGHRAKTHKLKHFKQSPSLQKADASSCSNKSSHQTKRNDKKLPSTGFKQQPICTPLAPTRNTLWVQLGIGAT